MIPFDLDEELKKPWPTPDRRLTEPELDTDFRPEEMLAWLWPLAATVIVGIILWACKHFGWLQ